MSPLVHSKLLTKTNKPSARVQQKNFRQFKIRKTKTKCKPKRKELKQKREKGKQQNMEKVTSLDKQNWKKDRERNTATERGRVKTQKEMVKFN